MDYFDHFETVRRQQIDALTAHPFDVLRGDELSRLAAGMGVNVADLMAQKNEKSAILTCPLCGQPSTHLVLCRGCPASAWGFDFEESFVPNARDLLKNRLADIINATTGNKEAAQYVAEHAYNFNGCSVCQTCFYHTLPTDVYKTCPLFLLREFTLTGASASLIIFSIENDDDIKKAGLRWIANLVRYWCKAWNTATDPLEYAAVHRWRAAIILGSTDVSDD